MSLWNFTSVCHAHFCFNIWGRCIAWNSRCARNDLISYDLTFWGVIMKYSSHPSLMSDLSPNCVVTPRSRPRSPPANIVLASWADRKGLDAAVTKNRCHVRFVNLFCWWLIWTQNISRVFIIFHSVINNQSYIRNREGLVFDTDMRARAATESQLLSPDGKLKALILLLV